MAIRMLKGRNRDVLDAIVTARDTRVAPDRSDIAKQPAEDVDIMNRVLDECPAAGSFEAPAPAARVVAPDGEELVVAQVGSEQGTKLRAGHQVLHHGEHWRVSQHESDLVHDAGRFDGGDHLAHLIERLREGFFAEHMETPPSRLDHQRGVLGRFGAYVHGVEPGQGQQFLRVGRDAARPGDRREPFRAGDVAVADRCVLSGHELGTQRSAEVSGVKAADVAAADEADDGNWHGTSRGEEICVHFTGGLPPLGERPRATTDTRTRPPAEGITWGRK